MNELLKKLERYGYEFGDCVFAVRMLRIMDELGCEFEDLFPFLSEDEYNFYETEERHLAAFTGSTFFTKSPYLQKIKDRYKGEEKEEYHYVVINDDSIIKYKLSAYTKKPYSDEDFTNLLASKKIYEQRNMNGQMSLVCTYHDGEYFDTVDYLIDEDANRLNELSDELALYEKKIAEIKLEQQEVLARRQENLARRENGEILVKVKTIIRSK